MTLTIEAQIEDFVNRDDQLRLMTQLIDQALPQRVLLISGPSGMGKSYLLAECRARCLARPTPFVYLDFSAPLADDYAAITGQIWEQLGPIGFETLAQTAQQTLAHITQAQSQAPTLSHQADPPLPVPTHGSADEIIGKVGNVARDSQVAIGKDITMIRAEVVHQITQIIQYEDPWVQQQIQLQMTSALRQCLIPYTTDRCVVFLFDSWAKGTTEVRNWLCRHLITWILDKQLPQAVLMIADAEELPLNQHPRRVARLTLRELTEDAIHSYWVEKRTLPANEVADVIKYSGGYPLLMMLMADRRALTLGGVA